MKHIGLSENIQASSFSTASGLTETWIVVRSKARDRFEKAVSDLFLDYNWALSELGIEKSAPIFSRLYLSDIVNQLPILSQEGFPGRISEFPVSVVEQRPLLSDEMILFAYHLGSNKRPVIDIETLLSQGLLKACRVKSENYEFVWGANLSHYGGLDSYDQTEGIFESYNAIINSVGMTMLGSAVRTWIYVRDIDNHYQGMVDARKQCFENHGLTHQSRYVASTGIEAKLPLPGNLVSLDFLNIAPLASDQIVRMEALGNLGPTIDYGVTFERGTKIIYGDRVHLFISGTASINPAGEVMFPSDAQKQAVRALENVLALLAPHGCDFADIAYFIVYVRNPGDKDRVLAALKPAIPLHVPLVFVEGSVCRPTWLVEVEAVAVAAAAGPYPDFA